MRAELYLIEKNKKWMIEEDWEEFSQEISDMNITVNFLILVLYSKPLNFHMKGMKVHIYEELSMVSRGYWVKIFGFLRI